MNISRSVGIGMLLCCFSKIAILALGGGALLGGSALALNYGPVPGILFSAGAGLICLAYHSMQMRSGKAACHVTAEA